MLPANLHHLYYFWAIARAGSISGATRTLMLNQSTLSQQLSLLEASLGRRLLTRGRRGVELTAEGRLAFEYCDRIFPQVDELVALMRGSGAVDVFLRVGVSRSVSREKVLSLLDWLDGRAPGISVKVVSGTPDELESRLRNHLVDVVLCDIDLSARIGADVRGRLVASIPHSFMAAAAIARRYKGLRDALRAEPLVLRDSEHPIRKEVDYFLHRNGITPSVNVEVDDGALILDFVLRGRGIGVLDLYGAAPFVRRGRLVSLHSETVGIRENLWLVSHRRPHGHERVALAVDSLMTRFRYDPQSTAQSGPGSPSR